MNDLAKEGRLTPKQAEEQYNRERKVHILHKAMIEEAKADPDIEDIWRYQSMARLD